MEGRDWSRPAYEAAMEGAKELPFRRRRWAWQNEYDAQNMRTESTRFPLDEDIRLRQCCREAHVTRYTLINYLLRTWMAAWEVYGRQDNRG